uniref:Uncharacterized protein n=1 Tax=Peronospora matthiolae TaxID=2874970 RepID=A0AAV1TIB5_9STRA
MRPHFTIVLLATSLVAAMDKAEQLDQPSAPGWKQSEKSVRGHLRGALAVDEEERQVMNSKLNAIAHEFADLTRSGQFGVASPHPRLFPL